MKVVVAPDSFGGWKTASAVASIIAGPLERAGHTVVLCPMSDGGEGLLDALKQAGVLRSIEDCPGTGPTGQPRTGRVGWLDDTMVVESSTWLRKSPPLDPWQSTSAGLGAVLQTRIGKPTVVGLGGSSTVDMGLGVLASLGAGLLARDGSVLRPTPERMHRLHRIALAPQLGRSWTIWADVRTELAAGARRFGPQKGVAPDDLQRLADGWQQVAAVLDAWRRHHHLPPIPRTLPGGGAAGGLGFVLASLGAELVPGVEACAKQLAVDRHLDDADVLVTGEGRLDATTADQKVVAYLADLCVRRGVHLAAVVGAQGQGAPVLAGQVYVCDGATDRTEALVLAVDALVRDLSTLTCRPGQSLRGAPAGRRSR